VVKDHLTKQSREFGFIKFADKDVVDLAIKEMHETILGGRQIKVEISRRSEPRRGTPGRYMGGPRGPREGDREGYDNRDRRDRYINK